MPSSTISWNEANPADSSRMGQGDDDLRSLKTALRTALAAEHYWPAASGAAGAHLLGTARSYYDVQSNVSSIGTDGALFVASNTSRLFHPGSDGTMQLGSFGALSAGSTPVGGQRFAWNQEIGGGGSLVYASGFSGIAFPITSASTTTDGSSIAIFIWISFADSAQAIPRERRVIGAGGVTFETTKANVISTGTVTL